jgi:hypothetical protein
MRSVTRWALSLKWYCMINLLHVCGRIPSPADCKSGPGGQAGKEAFCWCYEPETNKPPPPPLKQATKCFFLYYTHEYKYIDKRKVVQKGDRGEKCFCMFLSRFDASQERDIRCCDSRRMVVTAANASKSPFCPGRRANAGRNHKPEMHGTRPVLKRIFHGQKTRMGMEDPLGK